MTDSTGRRNGPAWLSRIPPARWLAEYRAAWLPGDAGGTGNRVRISGLEEWTIDDDGLVAESQGHYDEAEYERQLREACQSRRRSSRRPADPSNEGGSPAGSGRRRRRCTISLLH